MMLAARRAAAEWRPAPSGSKFSMAPSQYLPLLGPGVLALEPSAKQVHRWSSLALYHSPGQSAQQVRLNRAKVGMLVDQQ